MDDWMSEESDTEGTDDENEDENEDDDEEEEEYQEGTVQSMAGEEEFSYQS